MTADAFRARRREGPRHFTQKRPLVFVSAIEGFAAVAASKIRLSRDLRGRSIFDFCNRIGTYATLAICECPLRARSGHRRPNVIEYSLAAGQLMAQPHRAILYQL
jgi:hypothetical protein